MLSHVIRNLFSLFCFVSITASCSTYHSTENLKDKTVRGKIIGNNNEPYIGQNVAEYGFLLNSTLTDSNGEFTLVFEGSHSVIILTECFGDPCIRVELDKLNVINLDKVNRRKSAKLRRALSKYDSK